MIEQTRGVGARSCVGGALSGPRVTVVSSSAFEKLQPCRWAHSVAKLIFVALCARASRQIPAEGRCDLAYTHVAGIVVRPLAPLLAAHTVHDHMHRIDALFALMLCAVWTVLCLALGVICLLGLLDSFDIPIEPVHRGSGDLGRVILVLATLAVAMAAAWLGSRLIVRGFSKSSHPQRRRGSVRAKRK